MAYLVPGTQCFNDGFGSRDQGHHCASRDLPAIKGTRRHAANSDGGPAWLHPARDRWARMREVARWRWLAPKIDDSNNSVIGREVSFWTARRRAQAMAAFAQGFYRRLIEWMARFLFRGGIQRTGIPWDHRIVAFWGKLLLDAGPSLCAGCGPTLAVSHGGGRATPPTIVTPFGCLSFVLFSCRR
jgi:hypothetical protein